MKSLPKQSSLVLFSPAKVNLFLRVLERRADGFHNLASLFQALDLGDQITFTLSDADSLECDDPSIPIENNLILKALDLFRAKTGLLFSLFIQLEKRIPMEAGLGGGSSNAATTLWACNELMGRPACEEDLRIWAAEIGSDISFFFSSGTAYCSEKGQRVHSLPPLPSSQKLSVCKPKAGLSTAQIFQKLDLASCHTADPQELLQRMQKGEWLDVNDLEKPAFALMPQLAAFKSELQKEFDHVLMSGSGTSFLCAGKSGEGIEVSFIRRCSQNWYRPAEPGPDRL